MAENYGLMTGIANGIKEGMLAYQTQKQINRQNDLTNLLQGVETDPDTGGLRYTSQKQKEIDFQNQKMAFEQEKLKREGGLLDPSTDLSKAYGKFASDYSGTPIPEQMSGLDVKGLLPSLGNKLKAESMNENFMRKEKQFEKELDFKKQKELSESQLRKAREDALKNKSQNTGSSLPLDQKLLMTGLVRKKAEITPIADQFNQFVTQMENPNISENQKLQVARQSLKLMNSPMNPDAVGAEEVRRLSSFLTPSPDPFGPKGLKMGVDLKGFTDALKNSRDRLDGTMGKLNVQINEIMGRPNEDQSEVKGLIGSEKTYSSDVVDYAKKHGITNEQALAVKNKRSGGK